LKASICLFYTFFASLRATLSHLPYTQREKKLRFG
jgi:hypothetical protein